MESNGNGANRWWRRNKEVVLAGFGMAMLAFELVNAELRGGSFHYEFLICGAALCGIAIAALGDKRS